jgi:glycosyltransferase involved in cell wall biosynthesis
MEGLEDNLASSDLVYTADITYEFSAQAVTAKKKYGCKVVCLEWENIPFNHEEHDVIRRIKDMVRFGADHFIAVTERAKEALLIEGIAEDKIDVVPMGIDLDRFKYSRRVCMIWYMQREKFLEKEPLILNLSDFLWRAAERSLRHYVNGPKDSVFRITLYSEKIRRITKYINCIMLPTSSFCLASQLKTGRNSSAWYS